MSLNINELTLIRKKIIGIIFEVINIFFSFFYYDNFKYIKGNL